MKDGLVQQVGTPLELYRRPANRFVAGFIGSPAMNFMDGRAIMEHDRLIVQGESFSLRLPPAIIGDANLTGERALCVGIRPQHLRLGPASESGQLGLTGTLMVTEQLGHEQIVAIRLGSKDVRVAGVDPDLRLNPGMQIEVSAAVEYLHFFDAATGERLRSTA
jgi:multiple sugar transport system ATP-binding protein